MQGKFVLHRSLLENDLWLSEPFTKGQAWVDLIGLANHSPGYITKRGVKIPLDRGDVGWSELSLHRRWRWSRAKVRRFIDEMKMEQKVDIKQNNRISTIISIKNYNSYQSIGQQTVQQMLQQTGHEQRMIKNDNKRKIYKKKKNDNESMYELPPPNSDGLQKYRTLLKQKGVL